MNINVTLVGVVILVVILVPILYMIFVGSGAASKAKKKLVQLAKAKGGNPTQIDVIGNAVLGVDKTSKKLFYTRKNNPEGEFQMFEIEQLKSAVARVRKHSDGDFLWVGLDVNDKNQNFEIPFYIDESDDDASRDPQACLQDAKKWENLLRPMIKS